MHIAHCRRRIALFLKNNVKNLISLLHLVYGIKYNPCISFAATMALSSEHNIGFTLHTVACYFRLSSSMH